MAGGFLIHLCNMYHHVYARDNAAHAIQFFNSGVVSSCGGGDNKIGGLRSIRNSMSHNFVMYSCGIGISELQ